MIALITDFGLADPYVGVMKGAIYAQGYTGVVVDVCHTVTPYSIKHAQFILKTSYMYFPEHTIFVIVVDPGVGTQREIILAHDGTYYFLMPDNGIIGCLDVQKLSVWAINTHEFTHASATFHGRDIFAVIAARLAMHGLTSITLKECTTYNVTPFPLYDMKDRAILTTIVHIDRFGNCIISLPNDRYSLQFQSIRVHDKKFLLHHCTTYAELTHNAIGILQGSSGFIEICMNQNDCSAHLNVHIGDTVELLYE